MKRAICILLCVLFAAFLFSCKPKNSQPTNKINTADTTSRGTPIKYDYDINSVSMISTPDSTCFKKIGYDDANNILFVTFRVSNDSYIYYNVSIKTWNEFKNADSLGGYYNANIKDIYLCEKVILKK